MKTKQRKKPTKKYLRFKKRIIKKRKKTINVRSCKTLVRHKKCISAGQCNYRSVKKHNLCFSKKVPKLKKTTRKNYCIN